MTFEQWVEQEWGGDHPFPGQLAAARRAWNAAIKEEQDRCIAIIAGGDRPWQEIAAAIRAQP